MLGFSSFNSAAQKKAKCSCIRTVFQVCYIVKLLFGCLVLMLLCTYLHAICASTHTTHTPHIHHTHTHTHTHHTHTTHTTHTLSRLLAHADTTDPSLRHLLVNLWNLSARNTGQDTKVLVSLVQMSINKQLCGVYNYTSRGDMSLQGNTKLGPDHMTVNAV